MRYFYNVVLSVCLVACGESAPVWERVCDSEGVSTIIVGETTFQISSKVQGAYLGGNGPLLGNLNERERTNTRICPPSDGQPVFARRISFFSMEVQDTAGEDVRLPVDVRISHSPDTSADLYELRNWSALEFQDAGEGFRSTSNGSVGMGAAEVFVNETASLKTPKGNPVMFGCYYGQNKRGRNCFTWWSDGADVLYEYDFYDGDIPRSEWLSLHERIVEAIQKFRTLDQ